MRPYSIGSTCLIVNSVTWLVEEDEALLIETLPASRLKGPILKPPDV